jgi:S-adenosylmethionine:tRNA-ribosyltransferase-isomerase (queuine synthetase)
MGLLTELWHEFGQSKELKKEIDLRKSLIEANLEYLIEGDRSMLNDIKLIKADLEKLLNESSKSVDIDFDKEVGKVAQYLGRAINQKETSIFEYYAATKS